MSFKFKDFTFRNKNNFIEKINFEAEEGKITNVILPNPEEMVYFKRALLGKEKNASGRSLIDGLDIIDNKFVKSKTEVVQFDTIIERLIPAKWILILSLLSDPQFLKKARMRKADKKYDYLSFLASKNNLSDMELRRNIDSTVYSFINNLTKAENKLITHFRSQMKKFNLKKSLDVFSEEFPPQISVLFRAIVDLKTEIFLNSAVLVFLQCLYDNVFNLNNLRDSCTCEYNAKKSANKYIKSNASTFNYNQTKHMIHKQQKFINFKITELREHIIADSRQVKGLSKKFNFELNKFYIEKNISKESRADIDNDLLLWKKTLEDQQEDFSIQQENILYKIIPKEAKEISQEITFRIHEYHKKVMAGQIEIGNKNEFTMLKEHYKKQIKPITYQASQWTSNHINKLDMKFEWFLKSGLKISSLNRIYVRMLTAVYRNKTNIVFTNFLSSLTKKDYAHLLEVLKKFLVAYPKLTVIFLNEDFKSVNNYDEKMYTALAKKMVYLPSSSVFDIMFNEPKTQDDVKLTSLNYKKVRDGLIEIENKYWKVDTSLFGDEGMIYLNPFEISLNINEHVNSFPIPVRVIRTNKFFDDHMLCGLTEFKTKIYFYNKKIKFLKDKDLVLYISEKSISKIV